MQTSKPTVQRYRFYLDTHALCHCDMDMDSEGYWVEYGEYATLLKQYEALSLAYEKLKVNLLLSGI